MSEQARILTGLIGTGTTPSLTPPMHMQEAEALGMTYVYRPIDLSVLDIGAEDLPEIIAWCERLGFSALNVTHPCKQAVLPLLDRLDGTAAAIGAVNTVLLTAEGRIGFNTDTTGFERAFAEGFDQPKLSKVVQVGAGGAGTAVTDALVRLGVQQLAIVDLDVSRAQAIADRYQGLAHQHIQAASLAELPQLLAAADGVVNCTPIGMHDHPGVPFSIDLLRPEMWVAEVVYRPTQTQLVTEARQLGCQVLPGGAMAVAQAVDSFKLITGEEPDALRMQRHFEQLVEEEAQPVSQPSIMTKEY